MTRATSETSTATPRDPAGDAAARTRLALDQLALVNRSLRRSALTIPLFTLAIAGVLSSWHPWRPLAEWAAAVILCTLLAVLFNERFLRRARRPEELRRWTVLTCLARLLPVLALIAGAVLFWVPGDPLNHLVLSLIVMAWLSVSVTTPALYWPSFLSNFIPFLGAAVLLPLREDSLVYAGIAGLSFLYALYLLLLAVHSHRSGRDALLLRYAQERLIDELERANQAKSYFLASMSHELRTPLNAIMGFSDMIRSEVLGPVGHKTYRVYAEDIHESGRHLLSLISDILDMSRLESGRQHFVIEAIAADELVQACARTVKPLADSRRLSLRLDLARGLTLVADLRAMKQIMLNLLSNAIKFTPDGGCISAFAHPLPDGGAMLGVTDTGVGIDPEELPFLFEPFSQAMRDAMVTSAGAGLGLSLVKRLAEAHGGKVTLQSLPGEGTTVTVVLPPARAAQVAEAGAA